jgi:hypothetical protein
MLKVSSSVWASADKGTVPTFSFPDDTYFLHYLRFHNLIVCLAAKNQDLLFYSRKGELVGECSALAVSPVRYLLEISRDYLVLGKNVRPVTLTVIDMKAVLAGKKQSNTMVSFHAVTEHRQTLRAVHLLRDGSFVVISDNNVFATRWKLTHGPTVKLEQIEVRYYYYYYIFWRRIIEKWLNNAVHHRCIDFQRVAANRVCTLLPPARITYWPETMPAVSAFGIYARHTLAT